MVMIVRAFPVLKDRLNELRAFVKEMSDDRRSQADAFYTSYGIHRESWHLQETPNGPLVVNVTELNEDRMMESAARYANSQSDFDVWFKTQVKLVTGIDPAVQPLGPSTECIFEWIGQRQERVPAGF